ncbi:MAG: terminase small subunit [Aeromonas veronii]
MNELDVNELMTIGDFPGLADGIEDAVVPVEPLQLVSTESNPANRAMDLSDDYKNVRNMLYFQQQMLMEAAKVSLESARTSEAPRTMEVFATLMGQMTTTNKELLRIHKDMKDITSEQTKTDPGSGSSVGTQTITAQNVFLGTPAELMAQVGSQYDSPKKKVIDITPEKE